MAERGGPLREQRARAIAELVRRLGAVSVGELAERFQVSEMTIRRDLQLLHDRNEIERTHGGAVALERPTDEPPWTQRLGQQAAAKQSIGRLVARSIPDGSTVFLGSGTTTLAVADHLAGRQHLTVVTNALPIASALASSAVDVVVVGGFLRHREMSMIGHLAERALEQMRCDEVVMGMRGVDPDHGLTSEHLPELVTDQAVMRTSNRLTIVADATKLGHVAASKTAPVEAASRLVTDSEADPDLLAAIRARGVAVEIADSA
ncbi:DeoR/GlpR family DNA-binding transcription regulator [Egicoccus sp. AB-alg2]|uniref:DeoR/GlpR family DNA-binding transcription regulator n=1 Tax=Egicoccus sp. AB-alg2 TaxID=3242693 RepID=UPI00359D8A27